MDAQPTDSGESQDEDPAPVPTTCPYCGSPLRVKAFGNKTTELKCTKPKNDGAILAHSMTFYYKGV